MSQKTNLYTLEQAIKIFHDMNEFINKKIEKQIGDIVDSNTNYQNIKHKKHTLAELFSANSDVDNANKASIDIIKYQKRLLFTVGQQTKISQKDLLKHRNKDKLTDLTIDFILNIKNSNLKNTSLKMKNITGRYFLNFLIESRKVQKLKEQYNSTSNNASQEL